MAENSKVVYISNFAKELHFFLDIVRAIDCIHKDIFSRLTGDVPPAPKKIIGTVKDYDFEKKIRIFLTLELWLR